MSAVSWKIELDLCRCCHSEGNFKKLHDPYIVEGLEEMYSYMLKEWLDIDLFVVPDVPSTNAICDGCITRLREASDFKRQVIRCEERFKILYKQNIIKASRQSAVDQDVNIKEEIQDDDIKEDIPDELHDEEYKDAVDFNNEEEIISEEEIEDNSKKKKKRIKSKKTEKKKASTKTEQTESDPERKKLNSEDPSTFYTKKCQTDGTVTYTCIECSKIFYTAAGGINHYRCVHLGQRQQLHRCRICDVKVVAHVRAFHYEKEHGIPAPTCGACGKKFAFKNRLLRHQRIDHMGEKKFVCPDCGQKFALEYALKRHSVKHTNIRDFKCSLCEKSFKWKKNLTTHLKMHKDERNYVCKICEASFVQQSSWKYHMTKRHPEVD